MCIDDRLPAIELFQQRVERCMTEILVAIAREQADTFELEDVERIGDFGDQSLRCRAWELSRTRRNASANAHEGPPHIR